MDIQEDTNGKKMNLNSLVETLRVDTNARAVFLIDFSGQIVLTSGDPGDIDPSILGVLAAGGMATSMEVARTLEEDQITSLNYYKGANHEVYSSGINEQTCICLVVDQPSTTTQIGMIWLIMKRVIEELKHELRISMDDLPTDAVDIGEQFDEAFAEVMVDDRSEVSEPEILTESEVQFISTDEEGELISFDSAVKLGLVEQEDM